MKKKISKLIAVILSLALVITSISVYHDRTNAEETSLTDMIASAEYNVALNMQAAVYPAAVEGGHIQTDRWSIRCTGCSNTCDDFKAGLEL